MFYTLPQELITEIYEYDTTYRIAFKAVMAELQEMKSLLQLISFNAFNIIISESSCKAFLRKVKKDQLKRLAYFTNNTRFYYYYNHLKKKRMVIEILLHTFFNYNAETTLYKHLLIH